MHGIRQKTMERVPLRPLRLFLAFTGLLSLTVPTASAADLGTILEGVAVHPPARVDYREERHNPMFKEPMVLTGHLEYLDAGKLRKVISTPFAEDILVDGDHVVVSRDGETRKLPLNRSRALKLILGAIEGLLAGDEARLAESFEFYLSGENDAWALRMTPVSESISRRLTAIQVTGTDQSVSSIRIELPGDEWHLMTIGE